MERSVVVGGLLVSVSLVLSVMLSSYARREALHVGAADGAASAEVPAAPQPQVQVPLAPEIDIEKPARHEANLSVTDASHSAHKARSN
jgi:hypothetical protein